MAEREHLSMYEVHEVHDWPGRATRGPRIVVWYGQDRSEAESALERLSAKQDGSRFYYELSKPPGTASTWRVASHASASAQRGSRGPSPAATEDGTQTPSSPDGAS